MAMNRWSQMRDFDRLFTEVFSSRFGDNGGEARTWYLPLDIVDRGNAYQVKAALPGFKPKDVEVTFADGVLSIDARRKHEAEAADGNYLRHELTSGNYTRKIQLPGDIKQQDIKADFENGMLTIDLPKIPAPQPVKIPVSTSAGQQLVGANSNN